MRAVIDALQARRGVSKLTATTLVAEVGKLPRFERARADEKVRTHALARGSTRCDHT